MSVEPSSEFLTYLAAKGMAPGERLPPIQQIADELGVSVGKLREQLEVARELALVEVRPKTGVRAASYSFFPSVWTSLRFALSKDPSYFDPFESLRNHVESAFFEEAVRLLSDEDKVHLKDLIDRAWRKLRGDPIQIPHAEHRDLHLTIYSRLENPFVHGILEAYWEAYENVGLHVYADYTYLHEVWTYHERMIEDILNGDFTAAHTVLVEHTGLLHSRPKLARLEPGASRGARPASEHKPGVSK